MYKGLDLYSKVEDLLGVNDVSPVLYEYYFYTLNGLEFDSLLDIGCGRGAFLEEVRERFETPTLLGIDLSPLMVEATERRGLEAQHGDISQIDRKFQVITAVFDMVNYLDSVELASFMASVEDRLDDGGYFICDINSLYAFEEVAVGSFIRDDDSRFVTIDSFFENNQYYSEFTLFEGDGSCFTKSKESIIQYYHTVEDLESATNLKLIDTKPISIYGDEVEKFYLVFKRD